MGGSRGSWNGAVEGEDEYYSLVLNFKEAVFGVEKEIEIRRLESCGTCNGSGAKPGTKSSKCSTCGGQGRVVTSTRTPLGIFQQSMTCSSCNGTGETSTPCSTCSGEGRVVGQLTQFASEKAKRSIVVFEIKWNSTSIVRLTYRNI